MNFFDHQERARRSTALLVLYFSMAVLATAFAVNLVLYLFVWWLDARVTLADWLLSEPNLWATGITFAVIAAGTARKMWQLRGGGLALAGMLGATEISPDTTMPDERQLMNIIEEMSIASGIPVPRVFLLPREKGINAFVAGFRPTETVLVVTQGCIDTLDREELQGVIAHEYSHIFNADMRLNLRLMAALNGILAIGKVGEFILYNNLRPRNVRVRGRSSNQAAPIAFMIIFSLLMIAIGYIGLFLGRLIKAAISRQRELLADASAVQFTRYPAGIAGALIKIRNGTGSDLNSPHAEDMSHMCFGQTLPFKSIGGLLATHPPIEQRLEAIGPEWLARARVRARRQDETAAPTSVSAAAHASGGAAAFTAAASVSAATALRPKASASVGTVRPEHMGYARSILDAIPKELRHQLHQPRAACWVVYALAISVSRSEVSELLPILSLSELEQKEVRRLVEEVQRLGTRMRLPMLDMAIPALKQLDDGPRRELLRTLDKLVRADRRMTLFEFVLTHILEDHLADHPERNRRVRFHNYKAVQRDIQLLLSMMVHAGGHTGEKAEQIFRRAASGILPAEQPLLPSGACSLKLLTQALDNLQVLTPMLKGPLVDACADAVLADGKVQVLEAELLRGVCTLLDCPMPPLF